MSLDNLVAKCFSERVLRHSQLSHNIRLENIWPHPLRQLVDHVCRKTLEHTSGLMFYLRGDLSPPSPRTFMDIIRLV
jgi:hypothetical protein